MDDKIAQGTATLAFAASSEMWIAPSYPPIVHRGARKDNINA
jgi:hypothetical protein